MIKQLKNLMVVSLICICVTQTAFASPSIEGIQSYNKHNQNLADDIDRYRNADDLWDALREEFVLQHYENTPAVQSKIEWYLNNQGFLYRSASRASPYLYYILQQVKKRHLPAELVLLPIIESGYNPFSTSTVGAAGIWQLMPATAAGLGVRQDWWYDGRRDVIASTRAALNHLAYLQRVYDGNWLLALAAYDTGEGNLHKAIVANIRNGRDTDFWSLPVASETRNYVPSLLALAEIITHPDRYHIQLPPVRNAPYLAQVDVGAQIHLQMAAAFAGISYKRLKQLNPGYSQLLTPVKGPFKLVLPIERVEQFVENLVRSPLNTGIKWIHYRANAGDTLQSIATKFKTTPEAIRSLNHLSKASVSRGLNLLIPMDKNAPRKTNIAQSHKVPLRSLPMQTTATPVRNTSTHYSLLPGDTIYMIRKHDTVKSIADRFHVHPTALTAANQLATNKPLPVGKQIIIPTHTTQDNSGLMPGDTIYMVRKGDSIEKIANKFHSSPAAIRLANLLSENNLQVGERIVVPTHFRG